MTNVDLTSDKIFPCGWGLIYRVVCAPARFSDEEISDFVSREDPPGTSFNRWVVASDEDAREHSQWAEDGSETARKPCPDCADRVHVLMHC